MDSSFAREAGKSQRGFWFFFAFELVLTEIWVQLESPVTYTKQTIGLGSNRNTFGGRRFRFFPRFWQIAVVVRP
jgi:hypothetical protein